MASLQNLLITEAKVVMMKCLYVQEQASDLTSNLDNATISVMMTQDLTGSDLSMVSLLSGGGGCSAVSVLRIQGLVRLGAAPDMMNFSPQRNDLCVGCFCAKWGPCHACLLGAAVTMSV